MPVLPKTGGTSVDATLEIALSTVISFIVTAVISVCIIIIMVS